MARPLRVEYPGAYYHVMNRGNAGEDIFQSREDREKFLDYLGTTVERFGMVVHTYCLMGNHYHLLVETPLANLSSSIQWLNVSFAVFFNKKHERKGHLFGGRFKSLLIDAGEYLTVLSRYIHLNPVRAKMVRRPEDYPWSSYRALIGKKREPGWLETRELLSYFSPTGTSEGRNNKGEALREYREYVEGVDVESVENPSEQATGGFIVGGTDFVKWVRETYLAKRKDEKEIPQLRALRQKVPLERIVNAVCDEFHCDEEWVLEKGHKRNKARDVAMYIARGYSGESNTNVGKFFGGISGAGITRRCSVLTEELARDKRLRHKMQIIEERIVNS